MHKKLFLAFIIFVLLASSSWAFYFNRDVSYTNVRAGQRSIAMGQAMAGLADDISSLYLNPAGLSQTEGILISSDRLLNYQCYALGQTYPIDDEVTLSLSAANLSYSKGSERLDSNVLTFAYAAPLKIIPILKKMEGWYFGLALDNYLNVAFQQSGTSDISGSGMDINAGLLWKLRDWFSVGVAGRNLLPDSMGGKMTWGSSVGPVGIPFSYDAGFALKLSPIFNSPVYWPNQSWIFSYAFRSYNKSGLPQSHHAGLEWGWRNFFFLRAGWDQEDSSQGMDRVFPVGFGFKFTDWKADFTLQTNKSGGNSFNFSVVYIPKFIYFPETKNEAKRPLFLPFRVDNPIDDYITYDEQVVVNGTAKPKVIIEINGNRAYVNEKGDFRVIVPVKAGKNVIEVIGRFDNQQMREIRKVFRKPRLVIKEERKIVKDLSDVSAKLKKQDLSDEDLKRLTKEQQELIKKRVKLMDDRNKMESLVLLGVVDMDPKAEFEIEKDITRGELAVWLVRAAGTPLPSVKKAVAQDVAWDHPQAPYIQVAISQGLMYLYPDKTFRPDAVVSEEEGERIFQKFGVLR